MFGIFPKRKDNSEIFFSINKIQAMSQMAHIKVQNNSSKQFQWQSHPKQPGWNCTAQVLPTATMVATMMLEDAKEENGREHTACCQVKGRNFQEQTHSNYQKIPSCWKIGLYDGNEKTAHFSRALLSKPA